MKSHEFSVAALWQFHIATMLWMTNDDNGPLIDDLSMNDCKLYRYVTLSGGKHSYQYVTMVFLEFCKKPQRLPKTGFAFQDPPMFGGFSRGKLKKLAVLVAIMWLYDHNDRT
jgi:hypothetical protein